MKATTNRCLKAIRDLEKRGEPITSMALRDALEISATERSTGLDIAAGWISTLRRYGFLKISRGARVKGPVRSVQVYELTDWGRRYKTKASSSKGLRIAANPSED